MKLIWRKPKLIKNLFDTRAVSGRHIEKKFRVPLRTRVENNIVEIALFSVSMVLFLFSALDRDHRQFTDQSTGSTR